MFKICKVCGDNKNIKEFYKNISYKDKYSTTCKLCKLNYQKVYQRKNREKIIEYKKKYRQKNTDKIYIYNKEYNKSNKEKLLKAQRKRRKNPIILLNKRVSNHIYKALKRGKHGETWKKLVSFSLEELKSHLEKQFKDNMSWENIGKWHIDHITPVSSFNFKSYNDEEFKKCWSIDNLQPLWAKENLKKWKYL